MNLKHRNCMSVDEVKYSDRCRAPFSVGSPRVGVYSSVASVSIDVSDASTSASSLGRRFGCWWPRGGEYAREETDVESVSGRPKSLSPLDRSVWPSESSWPEDGRYA